MNNQIISMVITGIVVIVVDVILSVRKNKKERAYIREIARLKEVCKKNGIEYHDDEKKNENGKEEK